MLRHLLWAERQLSEGRACLLARLLLPSGSAQGLGEGGGLARCPLPPAARACWGCLSLLLGGSALPALRAAHRGYGVAKSRTRLSDFTFTFHFHALEKEMATHSSVLAWRIPGTGVKQLSSSSSSSKGFSGGSDG